MPSKSTPGHVNLVPMAVGYLCVDNFFVISEFPITRQILYELTGQQLLAGSLLTALL